MPAHKTWTVDDLRKLIIDYFTEPPFAKEAATIGDDWLYIELEGGERFYLAITSVKWAREGEIVEGSKVQVDAGFTCMKAGTKTVKKDEDGLYLDCDEGQHYIDGQLDGHSHYIGLKLVT